MNAVPLGGDLGIEAAADLKILMAPYLDEPQPLLLDAGQVHRVHTASMQVLCTFVRERRIAGYETRFVGASEGFIDAARLLGLDAHLGLDSEDQSQQQKLEAAA